MLREFILRKVDLNVRNDSLRSPSHYASQQGRVYIIKELINNKAYIDALDYRKRAPLHYASLKCNYNAAYELISAVASIEAKDNFGHSALDLAKRTLSGTYDAGDRIYLDESTKKECALVALLKESKGISP